MIQEASNSPFILNQIKATPWSKRNRIKDMLLLFRLMSKTRLSPAEGQLYFLLRNKYEEAYEQLLKEINPVRHQLYLEEKEKLLLQKEGQHQLESERQKEMVAIERKEYEEWIAFQKRA